MNTFSFQKANTFASTDVVKITGLKFDLARGNGSPVSGNITANSIDVQVEYRVNSGSWSLLGSGSTGVRPQVAASGSTVANTFGTVDLQFLTPVFFNSQTSDSLEFRMAWKRTFTTSSGGTATSRGWVDNVSLYGDAFAVPEPSSIAVFGLLVSGLALRRRK
ncbi:MAG: PEP-CTERM sorting domain-containing protein [Planctomycetes bacterium]|nr:PEP-CTERM sorting domain-containing protein [Planctomycetota bacterium]